MVLCDPDPRTRTIGETAQIIKQGLIKGGFTEDMITVVMNEKEATKISLEMAQPGDLVLLQADNIAEVINDVLAYKNQLME